MVGQIVLEEVEAALSCGGLVGAANHVEDLELAITGVAGVKRTSKLVHGDDLRSWHAIPQELETHTCFTRHHHHETLEQSINTRPEEC